MNRLLKAASALLDAAGPSALDKGFAITRACLPSPRMFHYGADAPVLAIYYATVTTCTAVSCPVHRNVCGHSALTIPSANPVSVDSQGRFGFWAVAGDVRSH
jgi:hypothetical protein